MRAGAILSFMNGTFLVVNDVTKSQSCVHVRQSPSSAAVVPGRSVSLQCSLQPKNNKSQIQCPQQDNVHWFRAGSEEPHTGLMYNSTNYSCVYRLSKTIGHSSDAGTYYCAVDTCGHILFGTGTKVDIGQTTEDQIPVTVAKPGDSVTFTCSADYKERVNWYKQSPGHTMQFIGFVYSQYKEVDQSSHDRFNLTKVDNKHALTIKNIEKEDEAIYYCHMTGEQNFMSSTFLIVEDVTKSQSCVHVRQSPSSAAVVPGRSVSLQCSLQPKNNKSQIQCPQQDNVHWFRAGSEEPHTGLMYNSTNYSCVYRLSKTIGHSSDAGTYYCAVDTCGHILFGTGTKVDTVTVALSVLLCGCVLVIIVLCVCVKRATVCDTAEVTYSKYSPDSVTDMRADVNYAALNFSSRKVRPSSKPRAEQECVYSSVRADQHT
ncbi:hypothetical protein WMY93_032075 [Mugilogobius chulae]|uniref:Ig-like domain-containing protein n=1 Tax=Mugilogobius chulae TaxID=88201 RepID=A0AAW0MCL6_9GOBI